MSEPQFEIQNVLKRAQSLDISDSFQPYSGVEIYTGEQDEDGKDVVYSAGDATGRVLTIHNAWGTQAQADNILEQIRGFAYQPFSATGALVDPAAEIGDGVSVNDIYSGIYKMSRTYSSLMSADIEAPQSEEIDHEYPFETKGNREITRKFSAVESELAVSSRKISAKVSKESPEGQTAFSWSLQDSSWEVKSNGKTVFKVTPSGAEVTGTIAATAGRIGGATNYFEINKNGSNALTTNGQVWGGTAVNGIYLGPRGLQIGRKPKNANDNSSYFSASSNGTIEARNMILTGTLNIGGTNITAAALRSGAQSAYTNGGTWSGTSTAWSNATKSNGNGPGYFHVGSLAVDGTSDFGNTLRAGTAIIRTLGIGTKYDYTTLSIQTKTISGVTIHYLGY